MRIPIIFSTVTGNSFKIAEAIKDEVPYAVGPYNISYVTDEMIEEADTLVLCYWCNKGKVDDATIELIKKLQGKKIMILGTLGASAQSEHAKAIKQGVRDLVMENNTLLNDFLCQGKIDPARTEKRRSIPEGELGYLNDERYKSHLESRKHPDEADYEAAREAVRIVAGCM